MKIEILLSDKNHPVFASLYTWKTRMLQTHEVTIHHQKTSLTGGDFLFLVSCTEIIEKRVRAKYRHALVLHASDLPNGRGWSPHIWAILNDATKVTVTLLEAEDLVDSGYIWAKTPVAIPKTALWDEINDKIFDAQIRLMDHAINEMPSIKPEAQGNIRTPAWPKRKPSDSEIDPNSSLADQFDSIRVADPQRFPTFFYLRGQKYKLMIEKFNEHSNDH